MSGDWENVVAGEIGVGAPVRVPRDGVSGIVDAVWITSRLEPRVRVKTTDGGHWIGSPDEIERTNP